MSINELVAGGGGAVLVLLTLIQIAPIEINPWSAIAAAIGRAINREVIARMEKLSDDVATIQRTMDERDAILCRSRILLFGDEILHEVRHSKEHFDQILLDISTYENYCDTHPTFENNQSVMTIQNIKDVYHDCMKKHDFL